MLMHGEKELFMEKTSILDFIAKLTGSTPSENKTDEQKKEDVTEKKEPEQNVRDSFMRSYNPFSAADSDKRQITSPRAAKPPKNTIDLKYGKNCAAEKKNDRSSDMVRFINRHNALSQSINKKDDD